MYDVGWSRTNAFSQRCALRGVVKPAMDAFERYKATLLEGFNRETLKFDAVLRDLLVDRKSYAPTAFVSELSLILLRS